MQISVVGLGKLGAPLLAVLASRGFDVCGIDVNPVPVGMISNGQAPVQEPLLQELLTANRARIRATTDWREAVMTTEMTCVIVPTPSGADGAFKNDYVIDAVEQIGAVLRQKPGYHLVVVNSTTMPGSVDGPIRQRLELASGKVVGRDLGLCYNPEFIALGNVVHGLLNPDFVLIGESDDRAGALLGDLYRRILGPDVPICRMNAVNAELTKISVNTYVTMKISFANMLAEICEGIDGADADVVTGAIGRDSRIGSKYLRGGTGYGGPCFPRDTIAFATAAARVAVDAPLATATHAINQHQLDRLTNLISENARPGDSVAVLGLSYKPATDVVEESQGLMLAARLAKAGFAVVGHDPLAEGPARAVLGAEISFAATVEQAAAEAEIVAIMVPWPEYCEFFRSWPGGLRTRVIVDCWRLAEGAAAAEEIELIRLGQRPREPSRILGKERSGRSS